MAKKQNSVGCACLLVVIAAVGLMLASQDDLLNSSSKSSAIQTSDWVAPDFIAFVGFCIGGALGLVSAFKESAGGIVETLFSTIICGLVFGFIFYGIGAALSWMF